MDTIINKTFDIVIPYVNPNDLIWVKLYYQYKGEGDEPYKEKRFRDTSFLKYVLRSIDKYMGFINNVFLIVQSESQVPKWVNRETVKVVLHEEFIPKEYLPTFNCNTIEMFMYRIPNLSERFIYFNDDTIINKLCIRDFFFEDGLCNLHSEKQTEEVGKNTWYNCQLNGTRIVNRILNIDEDENVWYKFPHTVTPLLKSKCEELFSLIGKEIYGGITRFRECKNFNQHLYAYYIENNKTCCSNIPVSFTYINLNKCTKSFLDNVNTLTLCINDNIRGDIKKIKEGYLVATNWLNNKFKDKSKYEL